MKLDTEAKSAFLSFNDQFMFVLFCLQFTLMNTELSLFVFFICALSSALNIIKD